MRRRYVTAILTAIGVVGYLALDDNQDGPASNSQQAIQQEPDYIIKGLQAQHYNEKGQLDRQIKALSAQHYPIDDHTTLQAPEMLLREGKEIKWAINAQQGKLTKADTLDLNGNVNVSPLQKEDKQFSLSTPHLSIDLKQQIADTEQQVLISSHSTQLTAKGMKLDLVKQQASFKSQVKGTHNPNAH